jgi:hypothetical protein
MNSSFARCFGAGEGRVRSARLDVEPLAEDRGVPRLGWRV